jgi:septal ring factor EnvC (AmiA/AmiB activator)
MCLGLASLAQAQQPASPMALPTHDQLELRLADAAMGAQRALCATLWQQGNDLEAQLNKLQEDFAALKAELAKYKEIMPNAPPVP